ncbi:MAG: methyltransferase domain-containing protein [Candidatus Aenigmarchaeota archaeon]|nr:methyltransferase domain-containing protein [Candidatus Aenigmarchaeota archaeon]
MSMAAFQRAISNNRLCNILTARNVRHFLKGQPIGGRVLEIGSAAGLTTIELARLFPSAEIRSTGHNKEQLWLARQRVNGSNISFGQWDPASLPYPDNYFDAAFEIYNFRCLADYRHAIGEIYRVLKAGAMFYVMDLPRRQTVFSRIFPSSSAFTAKEFYYELKEAGFRIRAFRETSDAFFIKAAKA